jgi:uncharacterized protein YcbK (DUF882 family)
MISRNFKYSEFERSDMAKRYGIDNTIPSHLKPNTKALVDKVLQPLRDVWGVIKINSGYRCKKLNELVGGVESSQHRTASACDVACSNPYALAKLAVDMGLPFDQIGLYDTFVHISHNNNGKQRGHIFYNKSYKGARVV